MNQYTVTPIGKVTNSTGEFIIQVDEQYRPALKGLTGFSHLCMIWWFSKCDDAQYRNSLECESPYKGSPEILGTFATRSPMRPNPIALSTVQILSIDEEKGIITLPYTDAEDGSPVLDLKPYTPSLDRILAPSVPEWCSNWPMSVEESGDFDWGSVFNF